MRGKSRTAWFIAPVLLTVSLVGLSEPVAGDSGRHTNGPPDTYVAAWDAIGVQAFSAAALSPAEGHTIFAYVGIAVYDAVMAVEGGYEPFAVDVDAPADASPEAAVVAAARRILVHYLPGQAASIIEPAYASSLATIADGQAKTDGVATGDAVAAAADRAARRMTASATRSPTRRRPNPFQGCGCRRRRRPPIGPYLGLMDPFGLRSADQFRPGGPPRLDSEQWAREYNEVKEIGSATSTTRTDEQTRRRGSGVKRPFSRRVARSAGSWLDHQARHRRRGTIQRDVVGDLRRRPHRLLRRQVQVRASGGRSRPSEAGETDGNAGTIGDPLWATLLPATPNHPEYPSAHSCITPAGGRVVARFLRTPIDRLPRPEPHRPRRSPRSPRVADLEYEVGNARIWGGIHFRSAVDDGVDIGKRVANWVLAHHFHRRG